MSLRDLKDFILTSRLMRVRAIKTSLLLVWQLLKHVKFYFNLTSSYRYDRIRYQRHCHGVAFDTTRGQQASKLLKSYHSLEKGLSLNNNERRTGFGIAKAQSVINEINAYQAQHDSDGVADAAAAAVREYHTFNTQHGLNLDFTSKWLHSRSDKFGIGGTRDVTKGDIQRAVSGVENDFFLLRHSIRDFTGESVAMEDIRHAVFLAQKTPSVCNRQGARVYCFKQAPSALQWQPGNAGFGHRASRALVVTCDLQAFSGTGERNQCWVDGGMFSMSLIYALHSMGYGTCPLAWTTEAKSDRRMRDALDIPENHAVVMFIAVGVLPQRFRVAKTYRLDLDQILIER